MGSFDVACSVSRITISGGDPVAYFPLELYKYAYDPRAENNTLIYPWCYYVPVCLPIFGEYFDYGFIDGIEENSSTKAVEKHFKKPIKNIVGSEGNAPCAGMFVLREIYQTMVDNQISDGGNTETKDEGYGRSSRKKLNKLYDAIRDALRKQKDEEEKRKAAKDKDKWQFGGAMENIQLYEAVQRGGFREFETFMKIYLPFYQRGWLKKQLADFMFFNISLNYANVHYFPAANGWQWGNHYGNRIVHQKALDILNKKIEESEKNRD